MLPLASVPHRQMLYLEVADHVYRDTYLFFHRPHQSGGASCHKTHLDLAVRH